MRYTVLLVCLLFTHTLAIAKDLSTNSAAPGIKVTSLPNTDISTGLNMISVAFTNYVYKGSSNLVEKAVATNKAYYSLVQTNETTTNVIEIVLVKAVGGETIVEGKSFYPQVVLEGTFAPSTAYNLTIHFPGESPVALPVSGSTNSLLYELIGPVTFSVLPFSANGSGGLGLQYNFSL